jgi:hypothetical protein
LALTVPLSRFTSRVGGGSAFFVRRQAHTTMKTFSKTLAVIALLWAVLTPPLLSVLDASNGIGPMTRLDRQLAGDLRSALPEASTIDTAQVSLPARLVSNSAAALDWAREATQKVLTLHTIDTMISSVVIIILSICIFRTSKRDANTAA